MPDLRIPRFHELLLPTLKAVSALGGSGSIPEIESRVVATQRLSEQQQDVLHKGGPQTEIAYRIAWCRTYLKYFELLTNSARGVWALTEAGDQFLADPALTDDKRVRILQDKRAERNRDARRERRARRDNGENGAEPAEVGEDVDEFDTGFRWKETLIRTMVALSADQFERLAQRLLREADFESVVVTGRSGDQGIDGTGTYRLGLMTFPVFFQCKKYAGSVGPGAVRDFRGAMQGRGDKGLLITTGTFTAAAKDEAVRPGTTPIDLVDGDRLCGLLKRYELGVQTRQVEQVTVDPQYFADL